MIDKIDHAALEAAARAATQGEWRRYSDDHNHQAVIGGYHYELMTLWHHCVGAIEKEMDANAAYIVAAQPSVILALLEERKRLVERLRVTRLGLSAAAGVFNAVGVADRSFAGQMLRAGLFDDESSAEDLSAEALVARATAAEAELAALKAERDEALCIAEGPSTLIDLARGSLERGFALHAAEAERDRLKALLAPFAADADVWADSVPDDYRPLCTEPGQTQAQPGSETTFTVGDLRNARAALAGEKEPKP